MIDLTDPKERERLREICEAATPGPRKWVRVEEPGCVPVSTLEGPVDTLCRYWNEQGPDARFLEAWTPETAEAALALIERLRKAFLWFYTETITIRWDQPTGKYEAYISATGKSGGLHVTALDAVMAVMAVLGEESV